MAANSRQCHAVLDAVRTLDHPTADEVFQQTRRTLPNISLGTVYRNLDRLVADGDIRMREIGGQNRYDPNTTPHVHIHDMETDALIDVPFTPKLQEALAELAAPHLDVQEDAIIEIRGRGRRLEPA